MKRILVFVAVMTMTALLVPAASAAGPILSITGGGTSENATFGPGTVRTVGFTAREYADDTFKGQVQVKNVLSNGVTISKVHGEVVCILKTSDVISGGQGYEIRYRITKSSGGGRLPLVPSKASTSRTIQPETRSATTSASTGTIRTADSQSISGSPSTSPGMRPSAVKSAFTTDT